MSQERSAEFLRDGLRAIIKWHGGDATGCNPQLLLDRITDLLAAAEAREAAEKKGIAAWLTDNHVRTKDGKLCCVEVRRPDTHGGMACTWKMKDFDIQAEMDGCEVGEEIVLRYVELTDAEFTALGDFDGW